MGVKAVTSWLNEHGYHTRVGARWGIGPLYLILTRATYKGEQHFNRKVWKTREAKPAAEQIAVPVDPIIDAATFDAVQAMLEAKNPRVMPPRVVTGPILLTGIATCAGCGGGMTLRTGKSGRYRYYTCATCAQKGKAACKGRSIPMEKLDRLVTERRLADKLPTPERIGKLLLGLLERQSARDEDHAVRLTALRAKLADAEGRLGRPYAAIESGIADPSDATLKERVANVKTERDIAQVAFDRRRRDAAKCPNHRRENRCVRRDDARQYAERRDAVPARLYPFHGRSGGGRRCGNPHHWPPDCPRTACDGRRCSSGRSAQFCSEVAHPTGFEPVASAFGGQWIRFSKHI